MWSVASFERAPSHCGSLPRCRGHRRIEAGTAVRTEQVNQQQGVECGHTPQQEGQVSVEQRKEDRLEAQSRQDGAHVPGPGALEAPGGGQPPAQGHEARRQQGERQEAVQQPREEGPRRPQRQHRGCIASNRCTQRSASTRPQRVLIPTLDTLPGTGARLARAVRPPTAPWPPAHARANGSSRAGAVHRQPQGEGARRIPSIRRPPPVRQPRVTVSPESPSVPGRDATQSTTTSSPSRMSPANSALASWSPIADCTSRRSGRAP